MAHLDPHESCTPGSCPCNPAPATSLYTVFGLTVLVPTRGYVDHGYVDHHGVYTGQHVAESADHAITLARTSLAVYPRSVRLINASAVEVGA